MKRRNLLTVPFGFMLALSLLLSLKTFIFGFENKDHPGLLREDINKDIVRGIHLLYDEKFMEAENLFRKIISESTEKPEGYFYIAMVTWSRLATGFWSPETVEKFRKRIDKTIYVARKRIEQGNPDSYDYFFLGGALGFKGRFELMRGKWLSSFFLAKDAIRALETCLKMDPGNKDVMLGLGTFDYYTARLSGVLKFLTYLLLHKGDKEEGLRKLQIAADEAIYSATEAKSVLLHIYLFLENDFKRALALAEDLSKRYDLNSRYHFLKGVCYLRLGMPVRFRDTVNGLRRRGSNISSPDLAALWRSRALYLESVSDLYQGRYPEARSKLTQIIDKTDSEKDPAMIAWPLIKLGMSYDLESEREEAEKYYQRVMKMRNGSGAQFLAKKLLDAPPEKSDSFIGY
jgi:tetratricopeptide (TPR) repeat protein